MSNFKSTILQASYYAHMKASEELFRSGHTERGNQITEAANEINEQLIKEQKKQILCENLLNKLLIESNLNINDNGYVGWVETLRFSRTTISS